MANRPEPEVDVTAELVRQLLLDQFPEFADASIRPLSRGWDNTNMRVGDHHLARIPHRQVATPLILHEQRWLPELSERIDLPISSPTHAGAPSDLFPWPWSITPFFEGDEAASGELDDAAVTAHVLGRFFEQLHTPAPADAPPNPYRGGPLEDRAESFLARLANLDESVWDVALISERFAQACNVAAAAERVWLHGDLHARNMIVNDGQLAAVIDWGDICAGDRATDLAGAFMLVPDQIDIVRQHLGTDDATWDRAWGWALNFAVIYLTSSDDDPVMGSIGSRLLTTLLDD